MNSVNSLGLMSKRGPLLKAFNDVLDSGAYSEGAQTKKFEGILKAQTRSPYAVSVNSCGSALYIAYRWLRDHRAVHNVAIQSNTFYATGAMALQNDLDVYLVDSSPDCPSMSYESLIDLWEHQKFEAVALTHIGGMIAKDYERIAGFCRDEGVLLLEDCAHAYGVEDGPLHPGVHADVSTWSFYPTKSVPIGEGGALTTHVEDLDTYARRFRSYGKYKEGNWLKYEPEGMNLRMDELHAAIGCVQLLRLPEILAARARDADRLSTLTLKPMFDRPTNLYKYIVQSQFGWKTSGAVYQSSDQLWSCLRGQVNSPVSLENSQRWAIEHMCLPLGEGMYDDTSDEEILSYLRTV